MPKYDYQCLDCKYTFEVFHGINEKPQKRCPRCEGKTQRLISGGSGVIFKGNGFYATDYKKKSPEANTCSSSSTHNAKSSEGSSNKCTQEPSSQCKSCAHNPRKETSS